MTGPSFGWTDEEVERLFRAMDLDDDGTIDVDEFIAAAMKDPSKMVGFICGSLWTLDSFIAI